MTKTGRRPCGNYLPQVLRLASRVPPGSAVQVEVLHDSWCALLNGSGPCDCDPEIIATPVETEQAGEEEEP